VISLGHQEIQQGNLYSMNLIYSKVKKTLIPDTKRTATWRCDMFGERLCGINWTKGRPLSAQGLKVTLTTQYDFGQFERVLRLVRDSDAGLLQGL
jgi:hypothetical protein